MRTGSLRALALGAVVLLFVCGVMTFSGSGSGVGSYGITWTLDLFLLPGGLPLRFGAGTGSCSGVTSGSPDTDSTSVGAEASGSTISVTSIDILHKPLFYC